MKNKTCSGYCKFFQDINRFSTNPVRQISTTESIYSFETALQNSTMIVQEKNETLEF
jgi:hypothetical protein